MYVTRPIAPPWDEASKNFAFSLATNLKRFRPTLLTNKRAQFDLPFNVRALPIYTSNSLDTFQKTRLLNTVSKLSSYDLVHFLFTPTPFNASLFKYTAKKSKTVQTIATLRLDLYSRKQLRKAIFGDAVIAYTRSTKSKLKNIGITNVSTIYPGIDLNRYRQRPKNKELMRILGVKKNDFVVAYPGEYTRLGATDMLKEVLPQLIKEIPNIKFIFACRIKNQSDAKIKHEIEKYTVKQSIDNNVIFTDTVSNMPNLYNLSDLVIFPVTNLDGKFDVPLVIIEAMACGKPVVVSDLEELKEYSSSNNAFIVQTGNKDSLFDTILRAHDNPEESKRIGRNGLKFVRDNFDILNIAKSYEKIYEELLKA